MCDHVELKNPSKTTYAQSPKLLSKRIMKHNTPLHHLHRFQGGIFEPCSIPGFMFHILCWEFLLMDVFVHPWVGEQIHPWSSTAKMVYNSLVCALFWMVNSRDRDPNSKVVIGDLQVTKGSRLVPAAAESPGGFWISSIWNGELYKLLLIAHRRQQLTTRSLLFCNLHHFLTYSMKKAFFFWYIFFAPDIFDDWFLGRPDQRKTLRSGLTGTFSFIMASQPTPP